MLVNKKLPIFAALVLAGSLLLFVPQERALSKQEASSSSIDPYGETAMETSGGKFVVKDIQFEGNRLIRSSELKGIASTFMNIELNYKNLMELKASIESHYAKQNLVAVVLIPAQDLSSEVLRVELVESALTDRETSRSLSQVNQVNQNKHAAAVAQVR